MLRVGKKRIHLQILIAVLMLCAVAALFGIRQHRLVERTQENIAFFFDPTAARAFAYGERHFDAIASQEYDVDRANYFFTEALKADPKYPMANYELARIAFLQSSFQLALYSIDQEFAVNPHPIPATYYVRALVEGYSAY